ncbi:unnamed protein product [Paramecium pentaurelia]|uniref:Uncharacterized protein n=1 Tax=Paramecium pentaurelia TaxID=43138 RepID=A0A8S1XSK4_9CILI|nr:unnamed protein product [Paramecium pentaurelia]
MSNYQKILIKMLTKYYVTESFLRGGGCGNSKSNPVQVQNSNNIQPDVHEFFSRFNYYISTIDSKSHMTANEQESQEIMIAIQWFIYQEENIYNLNKNTQYVKKSYDLILDGIIRLIKSCLMYIRTDPFKCLYILQITSSLSKVIFSFHLINEERFMNSETQRQFLQISSELEQLMEIEKNDLIQNQMELYLNLTNTSFEIAPTNQEDKEEILKGCLKGIIKYILKLGEGVDLIELLFQGACLLQKMSTVNQKKKQYEVYYQLDMLQWEVINYFKNYKQKDLEEILSQMEMIYDKLVKNSKNWKDHYCWIQMIGKIFIYNPLLTKTKLIQTNKYLNLELNSSSSQWKEYQKKGIIFQVNHSHDQAIILLNQLQNKKLLQNELLIIEDSFKGWENFIQFKELLMNDQNENNQYTFGSYLKCKLELNGKNTNRDDIYAINKIEKFLGFILPNKQLLLIKQNVEKLGIVLKCWQNLTKNKKANTRITQVTCQQQIEKLINNLLEYYQNTFNILKIIKLNQSKNFFNVEFLQQQKKMEQSNNLQKLKYLMKLLELILQQEIQEFKEKMDDEKSQTLKNSDKIDDIEILQQEKQYIIREIKKLNDLQDEKLQLANNLYSKLSFLPSTSMIQRSLQFKTVIQFNVY